MTSPTLLVRAEDLAVRASPVKTQLGGAEFSHLAQGGSFVAEGAVEDLKGEVNATEFRFVPACRNFCSNA